MLDEQGADGSGREDAWRDGTMHYSGIIQMERSRWGKTPRKFCNTAEKLTRGLHLHPRGALTKFQLVAVGG